MNQTSKIAAALFLAQFGLVSLAHAGRSAHRPWMARQSAKSSRTLEVDRTSLTRESSKPVSTRNDRAASNDGERIARQAASYRGTRYRYGGTSKFWGVDCSGLVQRVYSDLNLAQVPRTSAGLYKKGKPVHLNELSAGDLVFFKNTYRRGISHVGIYFGDNRFVHAQNRRHGVILTSMADPYYQLHYAGARRLY